MAPYEALYGRKSRSPINWHEAGEKKDMEKDIEPKIDFIEETTKAIKIKPKPKPHFCATLFQFPIPESFAK